MSNADATNNDALAASGARLRDFLRRPLAVAALVWLAIVAVAAVAAPLLAPYDPTQTHLEHVLALPSAEFLLGTDTLGRDVLSRLIFGGQISLLGVVTAVTVLLVIGVPLGLLAGYIGGAVDRVISVVVDVLLAIPVVVTLLVVIAIVGNNITVAMVAVGILGSPKVIRVVRSATISVRGELFVSAARVNGLPNSFIIFRHILPQVAGPIFVQTAIFAGTALLTQSGLEYLGIGSQPPTPTWGGMVAEAAEVIALDPWLLVPSGATIGLTILAFGLLGDALRDSNAERTSRPRHRALRRRAGEATHLRAAQVVLGDPSLLSVRDLSVAAPSADGDTLLVEGVSFDIRSGEVLGLVGESGCGKSVTGRALLGLPDGAQVSGGSILFEGRDLVGLSQRELRRLRGSGIALISQESTASLDPVYTVGSQIAELVRRHHRCSRREARQRALALLGDVRLPDPVAVADRYPFQLSGGMAQRVSIALALAGDPKLLIADEPTTALDVTVQSEILDLLRSLRERRSLAILLITHDWGVVADSCDRAVVMYAGQTMETAATVALFDAPQHPYTAALLSATPRRAEPRSVLAAIDGTVPPPGKWPVGCHFAPRCPVATAECREGAILVVEPAPDHLTRCLHSAQVVRGGIDVERITA